MANQNSRAHPQLSQGVYHIVNVASGTVIDVSLDARKSVKGYPLHGKLNQQWIVKPLGNGHSICSALSEHYLTVEKGANDGAHLIATPYPISWSVEPLYLERDSWVIAWPNAPFVFDLHWGNNKPGESISLRPRRHTEFCQRWRFVPHQTEPLVEQAAELPNASVRSPASKTDAKSSTTDCRVRASFTNATSPTTSTIETIVDSSEWSGVGSGELTITTTTTSITKLTTGPKLIEPEHGKRYRIINVGARTVIDLNGSDNISIIGHRAHGGLNQKWLLEQVGQHWTLRSAWDGRYIGFDGRPEEGACLIAVDRPVEWDILKDEKNESAYRIFVPGAPEPSINFDLSQESSGNPIILWKRSEVERGQKWKFEEVWL